jgi:alginate O-acetyltransferase complex protein AlgI
MTETTDNIDIGRGVLCYDGHCGACSGGARRFGPLLRRRGFRLLPLQDPLARSMTEASDQELLAEVHLVTPEPRRILRGVDALVYIAGAVPVMLPLRWVARLPGGMPVLRGMYRAFARNRYGISAACGWDGPDRHVHPTDHHRRKMGTSPFSSFAAVRDDLAGRLVPPVLWISLAVLSGRELPGWGWMWALALAMYLSCKWITFWPWRFAGSAERRMGYLLGCCAMDARRFFAAAAPVKPAAADWISGAFKAVAGAAMIWLIPRLLIDRSALLAGWAAMIGIALLLHFGLFHLLALLWRRCGIDAEPLMDRPTRAASLSDFWGRRWNSGFRDLAHGFVFVPLARVIGAAGATAVVFLISGLIHDAIISIPAGGGYGLPTLYFVIQGSGLGLERRWGRSTVGNREQAHRLNGMLHRIYAIAFVVAPLPLLFHPIFVRHVIVPMLYAIGGLS